MQIIWNKISYLKLRNVESIIPWNDVKVKSKVGDRSRGRPEGSLFNSYYTEV